MRYFVPYTLDGYDWHFEEFADKKSVLKLLNQYSSNPDFKFRVIEGREVKYEPVQLVTSFREVP